MKKYIKSSDEILFVIRDKNGNQLSAPTSDDGRLWDRVTQMENRGKRGLSVVVYDDRDEKRRIRNV